MTCYKEYDHTKKMQHKEMQQVIKHRYPYVDNHNTGPFTFYFSSQSRRTNAGPIVMQQYNKEGGYLLTLK